MKVKLIGLGAAGNKAAIRAIESGVFSKDTVRIINTTTKDINHEYDDISIVFGNHRGGCGKERLLANNLMKSALKEKSLGIETFLEKDDDLVILVNSSEGGTGCGASTILAKYINSVLGLNVHLFVFTGFEQDARGLQNTIEYFKDLDDSFTVEAISNKKFLDQAKNKTKAEKLANDEFVKRIRVLLGLDLRESDQNIDGTDLFKISTTAGFMNIEKHLIQNVKNVSDMSNLINDIFDYSKSLDYTMTAKRIGIILNVSDRTKKIDIDTAEIFKYTGEPFEVFYHIQDVKPGENEYIAFIVAGLKFPTDELKAVYNEYIQRTNNIDKSKDNFLNELNSLNTIEEDSMFDLKNKKNTKSFNEFFGDNDLNKENDNTEEVQTKKVNNTLVIKSRNKINNPFDEDDTNSFKV